MTTLYERLGGAQVVDTATSKLFQKAQEDPLLQLYFASADVRKVQHGYKVYLAGLLGSGEKYGGRPLHVAHKGTEITDLAFDSFVQLFLDALRELKVANGLVEEVSAKLMPLKNDVVDSFQWKGKHFYAATKAPV